MEEKTQRIYPSAPLENERHRNFFSCGSNRGSFMLGYELSSSLSNIEKDGKLGIHCVISDRVPLRCKYKCPIKSLAK